MFYYKIFKSKFMLLKRVFRYFLIGLIIFIVFLGFYIFKIHSLAVEGNRIFGLRCKEVNPYLISYKNLFLKYSEYVNKFVQQGSLNDQDKDKLVKYFKNYLEKMEEYTKAEKNWLAIQKKFMERWDFKLFFPWYMKKGIQYQYEMYQGYLNDALYILAIKDEKKMFSDKFSKARDQRNEAIERYNDFLFKMREIKDWRKYFMSVPLDKFCTEENLKIPSTENAIDWEKNLQEQIPEIMPIDPQTVS